MYKIKKNLGCKEKRKGGKDGGRERRLHLSTNTSLSILPTTLNCYFGFQAKQLQAMHRKRKCMSVIILMRSSIYFLLIYFNRMFI
jgi:hypothetical protein